GERGYVSDVARELIDGGRLERLLGDAKDALAEDPARAQMLFEETLALWRGPPLAECGQSGLARLEANRLDELHTPRARARGGGRALTWRARRGDSRDRGAGRGQPVARASAPAVDARAVSERPSRPGAVRLSRCVRGATLPTRPL